MATTKWNVRIIETCGDQREWNCKTSGDDKFVAIAKAIKRHFGPRAGLWQDSGIVHGVYGQVVSKTAQPWVSNCLTSKARFDAEPA